MIVSENVTSVLSDLPVKPPPDILGGVTQSRNQSKQYFERRLVSPFEKNLKDGTW